MNAKITSINIFRNKHFDEFSASRADVRDENVK